MQSTRVQIQSKQLACWIRWAGINQVAVCAACHDTSDMLHVLDQFEMGHDVAHCENGTSTLENLRPTHSACNSNMGSRTFLQYRKEEHSIDQAAQTTEEQKAVGPQKLFSYRVPRAKAIATYLRNIINRKKRPAELGRKPVPVLNPPWSCKTWRLPPARHHQPRLDCLVCIFDRIKLCV